MLIQLRPGAVVILEGLDKTGKTTQREALTQLGWAEPRPIVAHMPSGFAAISAKIYRLMEEHDTASPLARQLLHLACHAESLPALRAARNERGIILDRWWWSMIAYGLHGDPRVEVADGVFLDAVKAVWSDFNADVVFLFGEPHSGDSHNTSAIAAAYANLAAQANDVVVRVPRDDPIATTSLIIDRLFQRDLIEGV